jgi:hypothetical protein
MFIYICICELQVRLMKEELGWQAKVVPIALDQVMIFDFRTIKLITWVASWYSFFFFFFEAKI